MANNKRQSYQKEFDKSKSKGKARNKRGANQKSKTTCDNCGAEITFKDSKDRPNDVSWYAANPQLLTDAASLSFGNPLGVTTTLSATQDIGSTELKPLEFRVPGLISLDLALSPGYARSWNDPVNIAARNIYSYVRHANSGHSNYDAPDLMYYILAADSVYSMWSFLARTYGLMRAYSVYNRYWPKAVVESAGVDFNSILNNMADFRYRINQFAVKASSLCVPKDITMFARHSWLFSNVYLDDPGVKGQTYVFNPKCFYKYVITGTDATLEPVIIHKPNTLWTYQQLMTFAEEILDSMLVNEDMNIMSGDILKAYGQENLWKLASVPEDYLVTPVFNMEVLTQIHNATVLNADDTDVQLWNVSQDKSEGPERGCLIYKPQVATNDTSIQLLYPHVMDMPMDHPTPADVMVASRLMVGGTRTTADANHVKIEIFGTEIVSNGYVWTLKADGTTIGTPYSSAGSTKFNFRMAPIFRSCMYNKEYPSLMGMNSVDGELNNYTIVQPYILDKMHGTAQLSELSIPQMATFR